MKTRIFKFACYMQNLELALYIYPIECKGNGLLNAKRKLYIYTYIYNFIDAKEYFNGFALLF